LIAEKEKPEKCGEQLLRLIKVNVMNNNKDKCGKWVSVLSTSVSPTKERGLYLP